MKSMKALLALLLAFALFASACGSDDPVETVDAGSETADDTTDEAPADEAPADDTTDEAPADEAPADDTTDEAPADEAPADDTTDEAPADDGSAGLPGEGVEVTMARADWTTGYFQAEVYKIMMEELGYIVSEPSALELGPSLAYLAMAEGDFDFWVNSWYPGHFSWHEADLPDGSKVGDHVEIVGEEMLAGGLQGFLITKSFAEENDITTLDQIYNDPELSAMFDYDEDGAPDMYGCPESWTCDNIITEMACQFDWPLQQVQAGYDTMIAEAQDKADNGEPMVIYTWTPSAYITKLIPGNNVMWISVDGEVDDSNCAGQEGGEAYAQANATAAIGEDNCLYNSAGECRLGWTAADIQVTANSEFLDANPAAEALFAEVVMPLIDVAIANVEQESTDGSVGEIRSIAERWVADNRDLVDGWLATALAAG